ncbi:hypothetical protein [Marinovum sp.]|uniref:hypothetical protein n=1 Tax=Marinovum sp. TaxID=2024839 RepID=UPI003A8F2FF0
MCLITAFESQVRATPAPEDVTAPQISVARGEAGQVLVDVTGSSFHAASDHAIAVIDACAATEIEDDEGRARSSYAHGMVIRDEAGAPAGYRCIFQLEPLAETFTPRPAQHCVPLQAALR